MILVGARGITKKRVMAVGFILMTAVMFAGETKGKLILKGAGFKSDKGGAILYLYKKKDNIRGDGFLCMKNEIKEGVSYFALENIDYGEYGIKVVHDENGNGKMDMGIFGVEGVGFARNIRINKGLAYDDIKISFDAATAEINVQMQYPTLVGIMMENSEQKK